MTHAMMRADAAALPWHVSAHGPRGNVQGPPSSMLTALQFAANLQLAQCHKHNPGPAQHSVTTMWLYFTQLLQLSPCNPIIPKPAGIFRKQGVQVGLA